MTEPIDFQTGPSRYSHWRVDYHGEIAHLFMDVDEQGGLLGGYELKLNSYDLGVDIELADIVQRMRFEHPEVKAVILQSGKERVFCAGANIRMLAAASHEHKVNFCKFTNETRNAYEAAGTESGQYYLCAIKGTCAGGGYELALACDHIILADDGSSNIALPELPLLAVLPGTGGLTRLTDKRKLRRDLADVFCSTEEGVRGKRALEWRLVDDIVTNSKFDDLVTKRAMEFAAKSSRAAVGEGIKLGPLARSQSGENRIVYSTVELVIDRERRLANITISAPDRPAPDKISVLHEEGDRSWMLRCARELDDAILHLRFNEPEIGVIVFKTQGQAASVAAHEQFLLDHRGDWLANEILLLWKYVLKRIDMTARSLVALAEPGSCFAGVLAELMFAADRSYMADGIFEDDSRPEATIMLTEGNFGAYLMGNGLTRLQTRFLDAAGMVDAAAASIGETLTAGQAHQLGLITFCFDDVDWEDEVRIFLEERASFSPDALTGMEANLRFAGPETMETKIFARLTAWQNWIFQRPNAVGEDGALKRYGTGLRGAFDMRRV